MQRVKKDILSFRKYGKVVLLGDFNASVGKAANDDDVIGNFGEDMYNASVNTLISFLRVVEMLACNGRQLVSEPQWTRLRPSLDKNTVIDYILKDEQLMAVSGNVLVDSTDIGCFDHFLVWMELGRVIKGGKKAKHVLRRWHLERFDLKWWYKVCRLPDNRYSKQLLSQEWEIKPRKGRQRKTWNRTIDDIFYSLSLDKGEILDHIEKGNSFFMA